MDWYVLGLEPTKDKNAITAAYRQKLRQTNPEDKPEEFKALRTAYEQALAYADQEDTAPARDESPVGLWIEAIGNLYDDYAQRIDPKNWETLMASDVCVALDTRGAAEEALLKFLMERYFLPKAVWNVLDSTFAFSARMEELYENWPKDFIDHAVITGIRMDPVLDYDLFIPGQNGTDCDAYRQLFFQARQLTPQDAAPILEQMDALSERHPYGDALRYHGLLETDRAQEGKDGLQQLAQDYPDDAFLSLLWADICLTDGITDTAEAIASHILELSPNHVGAKVTCAKCLAAKGEYHTAKEQGYEIVRASGDNPVLQDQITELMKVWNEKLIVQRESRYAEAPADTANAVELAWCYAQNERLDDAMELAIKIDPNYEDQYTYHNLMGKLYHGVEDFENSLPHMQAVETILRNMEDDGTTETKKRLARLPEMLQIQANCLLQLGHQVEAKEKLEQALNEAPENTEVLSTMGKILMSSGDYSHAVEIFQQMLRISPTAWVAEYLMAVSLYFLHRDREAFDAADRALAIQGHDLGLYVLKMQILVRNELFAEVHDILDFLKEAGAPETADTEFIHAQLTELEKNDTKNALKQYQALQKRGQTGNDLIWSGELYYRLALLTGNQMDIQQEKNRNTVLEIVDQGLARTPYNTDLLSYKAWVLKQGGLREDAIAMYQALEEKNPQSPVALRGIADLYYEDMTRNAAQALTYYEKLLETQKTSELYFYAATCKRNLGDLEGARLYYLKELEMDPEDIDGYRGLAFISDARGRYEQSLEYLDKALSIMAEYGQTYEWMVTHKLNVLRRMGRHQEAIAFARQAAEQFQYQEAFKTQFEICCQFGLWEQAAQVLAQWKQANRTDPELMAATARLHLLQGKMFKAALAMAPAKHKLPYDQVQDFRLQLADLECNHTRRVQLLTQRVNQGVDSDLALINLAQAYWHAGKISAAKGAAQRALTMLDETLTQNQTDEALYRTRRAFALAVLGRVAEAREELAKARALPLCSHCEYNRCKDADVYEASIEEILGNTEDAKKLYTAGKTNWPDELDFISGATRLQKKGRK